MVLKQGGILNRRRVSLVRGARLRARLVSCRKPQRWLEPSQKEEQRSLSVGAHLVGLSPSSTDMCAWRLKTRPAKAWLVKRYQSNSKVFSEEYDVCEPSMDSLDVVGALRTLGILL